MCAHMNYVRLSLRHSGCKCVVLCCVSSVQVNTKLIVMLHARMCVCFGRVVLTKECMYYFDDAAHASAFLLDESEHAPAPRGYVSLGSVTTVSRSTNSNKANCFYVSTSSRKYQFVAQNAADMAEWVTAVQSVIV